MSNVISHSGFTAIRAEKTGRWDIHYCCNHIGYCTIGYTANGKAVHPRFYSSDWGLTPKSMRSVANLIGKIIIIESSTDANG